MKYETKNFQGGNSSLLLRLNAIPEILYWGKRIHNQWVTKDEECLIDRAVPQARLDTDVPMGLSPDTGRGWFGSPGLEGYRVGLDFAPVFTMESYCQSESEIEISLMDKTSALALFVDFAMDSKTRVP